MPTSTPVTSLVLSDRAEGLENGCQLDIMFVTELVADDLVRL